MQIRASASRLHREHRKVSIPFRSFARTAVALVLLAFPLSTSAAQDRYVEIAARHQRPRIYHEAFVLPGSANGHAVISFRIPNPLLVFVQDRSAFLSNVEVAVAVYRNEEKVDEQIWRQAQRAATFDVTQDRSEDVEGRVVFRLDPGLYTYRMTLNDGPADVERPFRVPDISADGISTPFIVKGLERDGTDIRLDPLNLGGDAPYGERARVVVPLGPDTGSAGAELQYRLYRIGRDRRETIRRDRGAQAPYQLEPEDVLVRNGTLKLDETVPVGRIDEGCLCWETSDEAVGRLAVLDLQIDELEDAEYLLDVVLKAHGETRRHRSTFRTHWRDMPLSLYDHVVAIRNLTFIESRETVRSMLRGSREERIERFRAYWLRRDPSPGTVFNELMDEYYRRIDHAASEFRSGKSPYPDGLLTDAAEVFIVHGPPHDISNSFPSSGGVQEVWSYSDGRRFVFWAPSSLEPMELQREDVPRGRAERGD